MKDASDDEVDDKHNYASDYHYKNKIEQTDVVQVNKQATKKDTKNDTINVDSNDDNDVDKTNAKTLNKWFDKKSNGAVRTLGLSKPVRNRQTNYNMSCCSSNNSGANTLIEKVNQ